VGDISGEMFNFRCKFGFKLMVHAGIKNIGNAVLWQMPVKGFDAIPVWQ
jgi:hypothetical protein